jgi:hypothetical protein
MLHLHFEAKKLICSSSSRWCICICTMSKHPGRTAFLGVLHSNCFSHTPLAPSLSPSRTLPDCGPSLLSCAGSTSSTTEKPVVSCRFDSHPLPRRAGSSRAGQLDSRRGAAGGAGRATRFAMDKRRADAGGAGAGRRHADRLHSLS